MITRQETLRRLEVIANEVVALRNALAEEWAEAPATDPTQAFLAKCHGWEDTRSPEEVVAEIYTARTSSSRGATLFREESS